MVRPRLQKREIAFLTWMLGKAVKETELGLVALETVRARVDRLKGQYRRTGDYQLFKELQTEIETYEQLPTWMQLTHFKHVCQGLILRFNRILDGHTRGRIPAKSDYARDLLSGMDPKKGENSKFFGSLINSDRKEAQNKLENPKENVHLTLLCNVNQPFNQLQRSQIGLVYLPLVNEGI